MMWRWSLRTSGMTRQNRMARYEDEVLVYFSRPNHFIVSG